MKHFLLTLGFMLTLGVLSAFGQQTGNKLWLKASKVLLPTGGKVSFEVEGTNPSATYKYKWPLPKQFKKLSERGNKVVVKIPDEGNYEVKVFVESNDESDDVELKTNVEVSNSKKIELCRVAATWATKGPIGSLMALLTPTITAKNGVPRERKNTKWW